MSCKSSVKPIAGPISNFCWETVLDKFNFNAQSREVSCFSGTSGNTWTNILPYKSTTWNQERLWKHFTQAICFPSGSTKGTFALRDLNLHWSNSQLYHPQWSIITHSGHMIVVCQAELGGHVRKDASLYTFHWNTGNQSLHPNLLARFFGPPLPDPMFPKRSWDGSYRTWPCCGFHLKESKPEKTWVKFEFVHDECIGYSFLDSKVWIVSHIFTLCIVHKS